MKPLQNWAPGIPRTRYKILYYIKWYLEKNGETPLLTEIREHIGVKFDSNIHRHLYRLEREGFIKVNYHYPRGIEVISGKD